MKLSTRDKLTTYLFCFVKMDGYFLLSDGINSLINEISSLNISLLSKHILTNCIQILKS